MPKRRAKRIRKTQTVTAAAHPVLLSTDLDSWAGEDLGRIGRQSALLGKVEALRLLADGRAFQASVRDLGPHPHQVEVSVNAGVLTSRCTCAHDGAGPCKHAVAAVQALRFPRPALKPGRGRRSGRTARGRGRILVQPPRPSGWVLTRDERVALGREDEINDRRRRARKEQAKVRRLPGGGGPPRFHVAGSEPGAPYTVVLRGDRAELGSCTCPDYGKNELAVCKHVERVRNWFAKRRKRLPKRVLSVWWRPREWAHKVPDALREIRVDASGEEIPPSLRSYFREDGWLSPVPRDTEPSTWAGAAIEAARREASERGWVWDLDPAVQGHVDAARREEDRVKMLASVEKGGPIWNGVVPRLAMRLHPYQEEGALLLARRGRAFLADDMGLGKTVQAIAASLLLRRAAGMRRALVVCPASLKHQWRREIEKACGESATVLDASRAERLEAYENWRDGFLVLNYELVLRDLDAIRASEPDLVVLDEAQRIKNWDTKTAKAVKRLETPWAFILTGTPLENRLVELHSLVEFLHPRALGPRWRLFPFHAVTDPEGRVLAYEGLDVLRSRLDGFFLRRDRETVLDQLPERTDNTFWTGMTPLQRKAYRKQASRVAGLLSKGQALTASEVRLLLRGLTNMRIVCNSFAQHAWHRFEKRLKSGEPPSSAQVKALHSPKLEEFARVLEDLLEESGSKVVVYSQWERMLRLAHYAVRDLLARREESAEVFHGGLNSVSRRRVLEIFRNRDDVRVLFSTDAGGLGLNLQDSASIVVNLEVPWNPAVLEQRIGRVHRLGQRRSVQVLHFVTRNAIEERVRQLVESKKALFDGLLVEEADQVVIRGAGQATMIEKIRMIVDDKD